MTNKKENCSVHSVESLDATYNSHTYNAPARSSTAFVMPLDMKKDLDYINPDRFEDIPVEDKSQIKEDEIYKQAHNLNHDLHNK